MERITVPVHVAASVSSDGVLRYEAWPIQMGEPYIHLTSTTVTVEVEKLKDPRLLAAERLRKEINDIQAKAQVEINNRERAIAQLLSIEMEDTNERSPS